MSQSNVGVVLVTGSSRGLGLQFCRHYVAAGWFVIATLRKLGSSEALEQLKQQAGEKMTIVEMDTSSEESINAAAESLISGSAFPAELGEKRIDLLINSAGFYGTKNPIGQLTSADMMDVFQTNTVGPLLVTQALLPLIRRSSMGGKIVMLTSELGSIGTNRSGGRYPYRTSKAALNAVIRSMAVDLAKENIMAFGVHPGWVQTDMGGPKADFTVPEAIENVAAVIQKAKIAEQNGAFLSHDGTPIPY
jgi:NAD(P)-dependent dehydrogenase (short-subunit alcohol dehydrogenase family)